MVSWILLAVETSLNLHAPGIVLLANHPIHATNSAAKTVWHSYIRTHLTHPNTHINLPLGQLTP